MNRKKPSVYIRIGIATLLIIMGIIIAAITWLNGGSLPSARIELPSSQMVTRIKMEQFDSGDSTGAVLTENHSDIDAILSALSSARRASLTWVSAAYDTPNVSNFLTIQIYEVDNEQQERWFIFSLYADGSKEYVHVSYSGIYRIDSKLSAEIYQMYDALMTNTP